MEQDPSQNMGCFNPLLFCINQNMECFNPLLFCMRKPLHAHDIGRRIKKLNENLDAIKARSASFSFINLGSYEDGGKNMVSSNSSTRETSWGLDESGLVGEKIEEDTRNLVDMLIQDHQTHQKYREIIVFAIVGVGGIGKTTLAQKIFNNEIIKQEFSKKLWLSVNQNFNQIEILKRTITEAGADHLAAGNTKATLERVLTEALKGHKTLLIMDDVWDHSVWEGVLRTPLVNATLSHGSRVLVTTRHDTVAQGMLAEKPYHRINKLEPEDAWLLLKKQVVGNGNNDEQNVNTLRDIGMGIIAKCDGLPLAIKVIGGILRQRRILRREWENVLNDSILSASQMPDELNNAVYLSYQDLNPNLKHCFLHYALLPKSIVFWSNSIVAMWISEGFLHGSSCDLEKLGYNYYNELIARNLIVPNQRFVGQEVCNMHDVVRSFAQYVARDEALIAHGSETSLTDRHNSQNAIRLSLEAKESESNEVEWSSLQVNRSLRTLILVGQMKINPGDSLSSFSSLRVVNIEGGNFNALSESLVHLKHLRYLSVEYTDTSRLPENIAKIKFLEHINLNGCQRLVKLPSGIGKLQQLRFLGLNGTSIHNIPKGFGRLTNLRNLYGFPAHVDGGWCSLEELGTLDQLMYLQVCGLKNVSSSSFGIKARLREKVRLTFLLLNCTSGDGDDHRLVKEEEQQQIMNVFDELCPPSCLEQFVIEGYFSRQLPSWMTSTSIEPLGSLRTLAIKDLPYCTEIPNGLCQLPNLELLLIISAPAIKHIGPEYLLLHHHENPSVMENIGSGFKIQVERCPNLERINNLPRLQNLLVMGCPKLKVLAGLPALQRLDLEDYDMETLPRYLHGVNPKHLLIDCSLSLLTCIAAGKSSPEWGKFNHIQQLKAYAREKSGERKWNVLFRRDPFRFETNISRSAIHRARVAQMILTYSITCPIGDQWPVERHVSADKRLPLCCISFRCNAYRHLVPWLRQTCLHCMEGVGIASSSDQWIDTPHFTAGSRCVI
ncbi:hypothetical protein BS78_K091700 [Paspalum vaginatum]|uniref:NB-ARC domain-containing protein n=1 Tax=Paspalum vaginatum TaxID=158149 RepID=A0A9W7X8I5_9POAL|nr:hypothetical protein BS78_K091700 [Paspalum vaginatum]